MYIGSVCTLISDGEVIAAMHHVANARVSMVLMIGGLLKGIHYILVYYCRFIAHSQKGIWYFIQSSYSYFYGSVTGIWNPILWHCFGLALGCTGRPDSD